MRQGKYIVRKGKFIHMDDIKKINWELIGSGVMIVLFMYMALMA
jgi:hypothetical protein